MKFTESYPNTWRDLQDLVALFLNQAGYKATSPRTIELVRGKVEVDVYIEAPDELIKCIICECKYWDTSVPQEKIHAFRTVVYDAGASLGLFISKNGFQSGAIEAAKCSNIKLMTWSEFTELLADRWIVTQLIKLKEKASLLSFYTDPLNFPYEDLTKEGLPKYRQAFDDYRNLWSTCWMLSKTDLENDSFPKARFYEAEKATTIESYVNFLFSEVDSAIKAFSDSIEHSMITIPQDKLANNKGWIFMNLY